MSVSRFDMSVQILVMVRERREGYAQACLGGVQRSGLAPDR